MPQIKNSRDFGRIALSMIETVQILASQSELVTEVKELLRALTTGRMKIVVDDETMSSTTETTDGA